VIKYSNGFLMERNIDVQAFSEARIATTPVFGRITP
jgi:hypothetical protein